MKAVEIVSRFEEDVAALTDDELSSLFDELQRTQEALRAARECLSPTEPDEDLEELAPAVYQRRRRLLRMLAITEATARAHQAAADAEMLARAQDEDLDEDLDRDDDRPTEPPRGPAPAASAEALDEEERLQHADLRALDAFARLIELHEAADQVVQVLVLQAMRAVVRCARPEMWEHFRERLDGSFDLARAEALWAGVSADLGSERRAPGSAPPAGGAP